jgi:hypothetical protein
MRFIILAVCIAAASAEWYHLATTFGPIPGLGTVNDLQPRTDQELVDDGWVQISSCGDSGKFVGDRWARSENDKDIVLIMDGNGFIAGMQSVVMKDKTFNDLYFDFTGSAWYVLDSFFGEEAFYATVYFVDTAIICNGGRTQADFDIQGTGNRLSFQNGPTEKDLMYIPLAKDQMLESSFWFEHLCFANMGDHFFNFPHNAGPDFDCKNDLAPFQVTYHDGAVNGFIFQHIGTLGGDRYETVPGFVLPSFIVGVPQCLNDLARVPGLNTMHVWVSDYIVFCF